MTTTPVRLDEDEIRTRYVESLIPRRDLTAAQLRILITICTYGGESLTAQVSMNRLAASCVMSRRYVSQNVNALERAGYLQILRPAQGPNVYVLNHVSATGGADD